MAEFYRLWKSRRKILEKLADLRRDAEEHAVLELQSCTRIQYNFRGYRVRRWVWVRRVASIEIQRLYRGMKGRQRARKRGDFISELRQSYLYHHLACAIQRYFRGYYSRKYKHDFNARKRYLQRVVEKGNTLRARMQQYYEETKKEAEEQAREKLAEEFKKLTQNLHHLLSTKKQPGVLKGVDGEVPTIDGLPVEQHILIGVRDLLRQKGYTKRGLVPNINGTGRVPCTFSNHLSVQASSSYDAVKQAQQTQARLSKLHFTADKDFQAGQRVKEKGYKRGINEGQPFLDPWKNPYMIRGIPTCQAELREPVVSFGKYPEVPYVTSVGGNKSHVLPNGLFSAIQEAEQSGGVTFRHKGRSLRFGIPDSVDERPEYELILPTSPPRRKVKNDPMMKMKQESGVPAEGVSAA